MQFPSVTTSMSAASDVVCQIEPMQPLTLWCVLAVLVLVIVLRPRQDLRAQQYSLPLCRSQTSPGTTSSLRGRRLELLVPCSQLTHPLARSKTPCVCDSTKRKCPRIHDSCATSLCLYPVYKCPAKGCFHVNIEKRAKKTGDGDFMKEHERKNFFRW